MHCSTIPYSLYGSTVTEPIQFLLSCSTRPTLKTASQRALHECLADTVNTWSCPCPLTLLPPWSTMVIECKWMLAVRASKWFRTIRKKTSEAATWGRKVFLAWQWEARMLPRRRWWDASYVEGDEAAWVPLPGRVCLMLNSAVEAMTQCWTYRVSPTRPPTCACVV